MFITRMVIIERYRTEGTMKAAPVIRLVTYKSVCYCHSVHDIFRDQATYLTLHINKLVASAYSIATNGA
jgi:hypothetical protein